MNYIYYKHYYNEGGVPQDVKIITNSLIKSEDRVYTTIGQLSALKKDDILILVGVNDISNILAMLICFLKGCSFKVIPFCQVSEFLDWYNPFINRQTPIINDNGHLSEASTGSSGQVSYKSRLLRRLWRKTFGRKLLASAEEIIVFSKYEKNNIDRIYKDNTFNFSIGTFTVSPSEVYCSRQTTLKSKNPKILVWSRLDYFYKGIDRAINYINDYNNDNEKKVDLFIIGPDYENGYQQIINNHKITKNIHIITDQKREAGDKQAIADCDVMLLLSRWDGVPRSLREANALNKPIISSPEANYDHWANGQTIITVGSSDEFKKALKTILEDPKEVIQDEQHSTSFMVQNF